VRLPEQGAVFRFPETREQATVMREYRASDAGGVLQHDGPGGLCVDAVA
jgi:hypothetical protein